MPQSWLWLEQLQTLCVSAHLWQLNEKVKQICFL